MPARKTEFDPPLETVKEHGTTAGYQKGCRCEACTIANRKYAREYGRNHYVPKAGSNKGGTYRRTDGTMPNSLH